ncbi:hypothetical protein GCM10018772_29910 [Streptomyces fumanus]|uniref:Uncharacterized protein n=1 Tax=Streptomyces fumanus TaxID=67302 RepID=A0A919AG92_9ACTN|nr:hypothetical protein GCM10018772_29910 [Streptomyces fumanus]
MVTWAMRASDLPTPPPATTVIWGTRRVATVHAVTLPLVYKRSKISECPTDSPLSARVPMRVAALATFESLETPATP